MCTLAHYIEAEGIPTVTIALIRAHAERIRPPRALAVPFELGRPLGSAGDPTFQKKVLGALLDLFDRKSGPILADFPEEAPAVEDFTGWACPIPPPERRQAEDDLGAMLTSELAEIRTWHDKARQRRGRTTVGLSGLSAPEAARFITSFIADPATPSPRPDVAPPDMLRLAAEDLKTYYREAATAQAHLTSSRPLNDWLWGQTVLATVLFRLRAICDTSDDPPIRGVVLSLVPLSELHRI